MQCDNLQGQKDEPLVSVIVPVYNAEKYLEECLQSVLAQDILSLELIFVDDGSTDSSLDIVKAAQASDDRVRLLEQSHEGAGAARNRGLVEARGRYIQFLDSDDWMEPHTLRTMVENAEKTQADIVVAQAYEFDDETGREWIASWMCKYRLLPDGVFSWRDVPECIFTAFPALVWNKLFRRSFVLDEHLSFQNIPRSNDVFFMGTAAVAAKRISVQKGAYVHHRVSNPNSCQATKDSYPQGFVEARIALLAELKRRGVYEDASDQKGVKVDFLNQALDTSVNMLTKFKTAQAFYDAASALVPQAGGSSVLGFEELAAEEYRNQLNFQLYEALARSPEEERLFQWSLVLYRAYKVSDARANSIKGGLVVRAYRKAKRALGRYKRRFERGR